MLMMAFCFFEGPVIYRKMMGRKKTSQFTPRRSARAEDGLNVTEVIEQEEEARQDFGVHDDTLDGLKSK